MASPELPTAAPEQILDFLGTPALELWNIIADELKDSESPSSFALRWAEWKIPERRNAIRGYKNGDEREMKQVLRWMLISSQHELEAEIQKYFEERAEKFESNMVYNLAVDWREPADISLECELSKYVCEIPAASIPSLYRKVTDIYRVLDWFGPHLDLEVCNRYMTAALETQNEYFSRITVEVGEQTAHERLEATLKWREWLESH